MAKQTSSTPPLKAQLDRNDPYRRTGEQLLLLPGDHIRVTRGAYTHHGIVVGWDGLKRWGKHLGVTSPHKQFGDYPVVHYASAKGGGNVDLTSLEQFLGDANEVDLVLHTTTGHLNRQETIHRAIAHIGLGNYNLVRHNCEHLSTWCSTGLWASTQVGYAAGIATLGTYFVAGAGVALIPLIASAVLLPRKPPVEPCRICKEPHEWTEQATGTAENLAVIEKRLATQQQAAAILRRRATHWPMKVLRCRQHPEVEAEVAARGTDAWCWCGNPMTGPRTRRPK